MTPENKREFDQLKVVADTERYKIWVKDDEPYLPGRKGQIEPFSLDGQTLAAFTARPIVLKHMLALPFVIPHQTGQSEGSVLFHVKHFFEMAYFLKLRKKRPRPTAAQITKGQAALRDFHKRHRTKKAEENRRMEVRGAAKYEKKKIISF